MATEGKLADVFLHNNYTAWDAVERLMNMAELHFLSMTRGSQVIQEYTLEQSKSSNKNRTLRTGLKKKKAENNADPVLSMAKTKIFNAFFSSFVIGA